MRYLSREIDEYIRKYSKVERKRNAGKITEKEFSIKTQSLTNNMTRLIIIEQESLKREREDVIFSLSDLEDKHSTGDIEDADYVDEQKLLQQRIFELDADIKKLNESERDIRTIFPKENAPTLSRITIIIIFVSILWISFYLAILRNPHTQSYRVEADGFEIIRPIVNECTLASDYFKCKFRKPPFPIEIVRIWIANSDTFDSCLGIVKVDGIELGDKPKAIQESAKEFEIYVEGCSNLGNTNGMRNITIRLYYNIIIDGKRTSQISGGEMVIIPQ